MKFKIKKDIEDKIEKIFEFESYIDEKGDFLLECNGKILLFIDKKRGIVHLSNSNIECFDSYPN